MLRKSINIGHSRSFVRHHNPIVLKSRSDGEGLGVQVRKTREAGFEVAEAYTRVAEGLVLILSREQEGESMRRGLRGA